MAHGPDATAGDPAAFRPASWRGAAGFFRTAQQFTGPWWLLDAEGQPCFVKAVHEVCAEEPPSDAVAVCDPAVRLRRWGFNAVGGGGDGAGRDDGLAFFATVDFCAGANLILAPEIRLPDVFDPDWSQRAAMRAAVACGPLAAAPDLIGWISDDNLAWGSAHREACPGLLQVCLSLEPAFAAYHAAWEFVLALHGGRLEALARAWGLPLPNKEVLRDLTRSEKAVRTRGYQRDEARWTREFSRRYFTSAAAAVRGADPNHLFCGCRFRAPAGAAVLDAVVYPTVDVALLHWAELPVAGANEAPVLAGELAWEDPVAEQAVGSEPSSRKPPRLTSFERMLRRGRTTLKRLARHPAVVGYVWGRWRDEAGEQPPFARGLVHLDGSEAREHTELLTEFNARADTLRRSASKRLSP